MTYIIRHRLPSFFSALTLALFLQATGGADENPGPQKDALPGLRQPGEDVTTELKDPVKVTDEKKKEALASYMEGIAAQKNGKLNDALKAFQKASNADPTASEPVKAHAMLLMRLGRVGQAREKARKAIELDPNDFQTRIQLAVMILSDRGNPADAVRLIEEALASESLVKESKEFISIHAVRGRLYIQARDAARAAESYLAILDALEEPEKYGLDFREHQRLMSDRTTGYDTVGKIMLEVGRNDEAIRAFSALVRVNENRPDEHHFWLALAQFRKDGLEDSETNLDLYFDSNKRSRESLSLLNDIYKATKRSDEVITRLRELSKDTADAGKVNLFIGDLLVEKGDGPGAATVYRSLIEQTGDTSGYLGLVRVAIVEGDAKELQQSVHKALRARVELEELAILMPLIVNDIEFGQKVVDTVVESLKDDSIEQNPSATFYFSQLAGADFLDLPEQEGVLLQATLSQNPDPALGIEAMGRLGLNQYMREQYADASTTFRRLLSLPGLPDGDRINTLYRLSAVEAESKNYDKAIVAIETALKLRPQFPQLVHQLGLIQLQARQFDAAEETLKRSIRLAKSDPRLEGQGRALLGSLYSQLHRWTDAIEVYIQLADMQGIAPEMASRARSALSNAYVQNGDLSNGERVLEEVYAQTPDDVGVNNDLGYLYADQNKNLDKAEKMIRIAVEAQPKNPAYLDSLGWVLYRLGRHEEALEVLKKATSDEGYQDATIIEHRGDVESALKNAKQAVESWNKALTVEKKSPSPDEAIIKRLEEKVKESSVDTP